MNPSSAQKEWANRLRSQLGGLAAVTNFYDETNTAQIPIFTSTNSDGIVASTIGLMEVDQSRQPSKEIRTEILMDQRGHDERICNILSTIAFYILKNGWRVAPGTIFESMVSMYIPDTCLPHVYFTAPFQWDNMAKVSLSDRIIYPLIAVPISETESVVAGKNTGRDLEALWVQRGTDVLNWGRRSAT